MDEQRGLCRPLAPGAGPAEPRQPAPDSRSTAGTPGPGEGRAAGKDRERRAPLGGRGEGKICASEVQGEQDGIPRLLRTAVAGARLGNSRHGKAADPRGDGGRARTPGIAAAPAPGSPHRSSISEAGSAPLLPART